MIYREAGDFKTSYRDDGQTFPIRLDRWSYYAILALAFGVVPFVINDYWANAVLVPFLIYAIAALGLNILTGYAGQVSLGTGGFMAVGAYSSYKLMTAFPEVSVILHILLAGGITAAVGVLFGLPSLRIKGFYLAVATLAAQFFLVWLFNKVPWFYNYSASGQITAPTRTVWDHAVTGPATSATAPRAASSAATVATSSPAASDVAKPRMGKPSSTMRIGPCRTSAALNASAWIEDVSFSFSAASCAMPRP